MVVLRDFIGVLLRWTPRFGKRSHPCGPHVWIVLVVLLTAWSFRPCLSLADSDSQSVRETVNLAAFLVKSKDSAKAQRLLEELDESQVRAEGLQVRVASLRGLIGLQSKDNKTAVKAFTKALDLMVSDPDNPDSEAKQRDSLLLHRAQARFSMEHYRKALSDLKQIQDLTSNPAVLLLTAMAEMGSQ